MGRSLLDAYWAYAQELRATFLLFPNAVHQDQASAAGWKHVD
jgi:hypothetical protein